MRLIYVVTILFSIIGCQTGQSLKGDSREISSESQHITMADYLGTWCMVNRNTKQGHQMTFLENGSFSGRTYSYSDKKFSEKSFGEHSLEKKTPESIVKVSLKNSNKSFTELPVTKLHRDSIIMFQGQRYFECDVDHRFNSECLYNGYAVPPLTRAGGYLCSGGNWN